MTLGGRLFSQILIRADEVDNTQIVSVVQQKMSNYDTDMFTPYFDAIHQGNNYYCELLIGLDSFLVR